MDCFRAFFKLGCNTEKNGRGEELHAQKSELGLLVLWVWVVEPAPGVSTAPEWRLVLADEKGVKWTLTADQLLVRVCLPRPTTKEEAAEEESKLQIFEQVGALPANSNLPLLPTKLFQPQVIGLSLPFIPNAMGKSLATALHRAFSKFLAAKLLIGVGRPGVRRSGARSCRAKLSLETALWDCNNRMWGVGVGVEGDGESESGEGQHFSNIKYEYTAVSWAYEIFSHQHKNYKKYRCKQPSELRWSMTFEEGNEAEVAEGKAASEIEGSGGLWIISEDWGRTQ
ncbi:hypothetical protein B0J14DRAFT_671017 [Halenospora varia]|nr:hypothetical protein B0J14DRAFT_671017 [Halenospora varia]